MALIDVSLIQDTVLSWFEDERPTIETVINRFMDGRRLTLYFGRRPINSSFSLPSIEVEATGEEEGWHAVRVQKETTSLEVDVTVDIQNVETAKRCLNALTNLVVAIMAYPYHLQPHINNTNSYLWNCLPNNVAYRTEGSNLRIATVSWRGERLQYLVNNLFSSPHQVPSPIVFPPI